MCMFIFFWRILSRESLVVYFHGPFRMTIYEQFEVIYFISVMCFITIWTYVLSHISDSMCIPIIVTVKQFSVVVHLRAGCTDSVYNIVFILASL